MADTAGRFPDAEHVPAGLLYVWPAGWQRGHDLDVNFDNDAGAL